MNKKLTILLSGGLDSVIAYYYALAQGYKAEDIFCLFVDLGQPYNWKEKLCISTLPFKVHVISCDLIREEFGNVPSPENDKQIIPGRNMLFALLGATFGDTVWLSALDGERHEESLAIDKSDMFFRDATHMLTYLFSMVRPETKLETPFKDMSKYDIVKWAVENGVSKEVLLSTSTCYDESRRNCGVCPTCFKRWIAMYPNGIEEYHTMANPPELVLEKGTWHNEYVKKILNCIKENDFSRYSEKRCTETVNALDMYFDGKGMPDWALHL